MPGSFFAGPLAAPSASTSAATVPSPSTAATKSNGPSASIPALPPRDTSQQHSEWAKILPPQVSPSVPATRSRSAQAKPTPATRKRELAPRTPAPPSALVSGGMIGQPSFDAASFQRDEATPAPNIIWKGNNCYQATVLQLLICNRYHDHFNTSATKCTCARVRAYIYVLRVRINRIRICICISRTCMLELVDVCDEYKFRSAVHVRVSR